MKVLIVEDEMMAAQRLKNMISAIDASIEIIDVLEGVEDTVRYLEEHDSPDLIFMDIQLSDGISFEIFNLTTVGSPVVFTTAYDNYAINAFRVQALDYLLKPIKKDELLIAIDRAKSNEVKKVDKSNDLNHPNQIKKILIKLGQNLKVLTLDEATLYYSENKISFYLNKDGRRYPIDMSLDRLEGVLDPKKYFRVNRQFIVKQESIVNMVSYSVNRIKLLIEPDSKHEIIVSKDKVSRFRKWLVE